MDEQRRGERAMSRPADGPAEEAELTRRLRGHDESVLAEVLEVWGAAIWQSLRRRYGHLFRAEDIEDILSIALFRLWQHRSRKRAAGSLRAWWYRIADNTARDVLRYGWHRARRLEQHDQAWDRVAAPQVPFATSAGPQDSVPPKTGAATASSEASPLAPIATAVREIVAELPHLQRTIVWADACCRDGPASSQYLAEKLGIPAGTVRVYRKRALDRIRAELSRRGYPPREVEVFHDAVQ